MTPSLGAVSPAPPSTLPCGTRNSTASATTTPEKADTTRNARCGTRCTRVAPGHSSARQGASPRRRLRPTSKATLEPRSPHRSPQHTGPPSFVEQFDDKYSQSFCPISLTRTCQKLRSRAANQPRYQDFLKTICLAISTTSSGRKPLKKSACHESRLM